MEWFETKWTFKDDLVQALCRGQGCLSQDQAPPSPVQCNLEPFQAGASTTFLGNPCQCLTTRIVKSLFLVSNPNLALVA